MPPRLRQALEGLLAIILATLATRYDGRSYTAILWVAAAAVVLILAGDILWGRRRAKLVEPDPRPQTQREIRLPGPRAGHMPFPFVEIHAEGQTIDNATGLYRIGPLRITNLEYERRASLTFRVYADESGGNETSRYQLLNLPLRPDPDGGKALSMPIDLDPQSSASGTLAFNLRKDRLPWNDPALEELTGMRVEVEDHLSGATMVIPPIGRWRTPRDEG
jgi:hypothetical protein